MNLETGEYWVRYRLTASPPSYFSTILGDYAHNARGALDNLVWQLVLRNRGGREPESERERRSVQFPIEDPERWSYDIAALRFLTFEQRALIESAQPHLREGPERAPLAFLRDLSNTDKHRNIELLIHGFHPDNRPTIRLGAFHNCGQLLDPHYIASSGPLEDGTPLAYLRFTWLKPDSYVDMDLEATLDPMIHRGDRLLPMHTAVNTALHEVRWLITSCKGFFPPPPRDFPQDLWGLSLARPTRHA
jgi:hypothetical protein